MALSGQHMKIQVSTGWTRNGISVLPVTHLNYSLCVCVFFGSTANHRFYQFVNYRTNIPKAQTHLTLELVLLTGVSGRFLGITG